MRRKVSVRENDASSAPNRILRAVYLRPSNHSGSDWQSDQRLGRIAADPRKLSGFSRRAKSDCSRLSYRSSGLLEFHERGENRI